MNDPRDYLKAITWILAVLLVVAVLILFVLAAIYANTAGLAR